MSRSTRLRFVCSAMAVLCLLVGLGRLGSAAVPLVNPLWLTGGIICHGFRCAVLYEPLALLGPAARAEAADRPEISERLQASSRRPQVRALLFASKLARAVPDALMYFALALALRRFASGDPFGLAAVRWVRRAAVAAAASALAQPFATSLRSTALQPAVTGKEQLVLAVGDQVLAGLFLAGVVWVAAWALEEGRRTQDELAQYV